MLSEPSRAAPPAPPVLERKRLLQSLWPVVWVLGAMVAGAIVGFVGGPWVLSLAQIAKLLIQMIKAAATPLVFFAVLEAVLRHNVRGKDFSKLLAVVFANAAIAVGIGLLVANLFQPGRYLAFLRERMDVKALAAPELGTLLQKQIPASVLQPFTDNDILGTVAIALLIGFAWRRVRRTRDDLAPLLEGGSAWVSAGREIAETILTWVVKLVPLAVFVASAKITYEHGFSPFEGLGRYVLWCLFGMLLHLAVTYSAWLVWVARVGVARFWRAAMEPVIYAFGVNSSLVALPLTLRALDRLGVSRRAGTLTACIGTNLNNDGIILYEGFTLLALAQALGMDLGIGAQISAALYCVVAAMGVAGVPEAGVVALTLVLGSFGLPTEALAVLLSVDWIVARGRSALNVSSDMVGATVLTRWLEPVPESTRAPTATRPE